MSYKPQIKNEEDIVDESTAELLSMPDAVNIYVGVGFIRPGLASWGDSIIYISPEVCAQMAYTMKGKPMTLEHPAGLITAENRDKYMIGCVTDVWKSERDDGYDCRFYINPEKNNGEEAISALEWKDDTPPRIQHLSCVYQVERWGDGGSLNGVKYDREVLAGTMLQLALTENPRYDGTMVIRNSESSDNIVCGGGLDSQIKNQYNKNNEPKGQKMNFWKKTKVDLDMDTMVDTEHGAKSISELVQIANSSVELKKECEELKSQLKNVGFSTDALTTTEKDKKCVESKQAQMSNYCDKEQPKNEDDEEEDKDDKKDESKKDDEGKDDKDQPKNSMSVLDKEEAELNKQIFNSAETHSVENNLYAGMARAKADFAMD